MKKLLVVAVIAGLAYCANAGSFLVHVKMPDGNVITFDIASVPNPDSAGMFRFHLKNSGDIIVHSSNVWIEEKSNKGKAKGKR